jgi:hypothetical protein
VITYIFEFDIVPGKEDAYWKFMEEEGTPFWLQFPFVKSYEVFSKLGGNCAFEGHVELDSFSDFDVIWSHPDTGRVSQKTAEFTLNTQRRFLTHYKSYAKK